MPEFDSRYLQCLSNGRPHVVLLGAGASRAACPNGDRRGRPLPVMADILEVVGLRPLLDSVGICSDGKDFESLYSRLICEGTQPELTAEIEHSVFDYFAALELPDEPTLYDHLVLSLREKDLIASFNWDPLLMQAVARNQRAGAMPRTLFLHGNVAIGYCMSHPKVHVGRRGNKCRICGATLSSTPLLFPVTEKSYQNDPYIKKCWQWVQQELKDARILTIFGYGAPTTDVEAVKLLHAAWDPNQSQQFKTMEIIDIRDERQLGDTWRPFFPSTYYSFHKEFHGSLLSCYPRRSFESIFRAEINCEYVAENSIPPTVNWQELRAWFRPLIKAEEA